MSFEENINPTHPIFVADFTKNWQKYLSNVT